LIQYFSKYVFVILFYFVFSVAANSLLLSGLIRYGNDTAIWDIPYRALASALLSQGDLPLWYPNAGNGFPQLNFQWISWVANPLGVAIASIRPYDYFSFAVENSIWRAFGFAGAYLFARQWTAHRVGAAAIAATYVGSGTMAWAALSFSALIGQMFAPWILAAGSVAIRANSASKVAFAGGLLGITSGLMVLSAYPGSWLSAPVLSGPVLIFLALSYRGGVARLLVATVAGATLAGLIILPLLSETTSVTLIEGSVIYSRRSEAIREGLLRGIDLVGLFLVNPSYIPRVASPLLLPIYFGIIPLVIVASSLGARHRMSPAILFTITAILGLVIANFQNGTLWDHPLFRDMEIFKNLFYSYDFMTIAFVFVVPIWLVSRSWGTKFPFETVDTVLLGGACWVLLVSGDNPVANFLRFNVPPFVLVRYNHLYCWLVALLISTFAWRRIERISGEGTVSNLVPEASRAWGSHLAAVGVACLVVAALVAIATPDSYGLGAPHDGMSAMGSPHLAWQAIILGVSIVTGSVAFLRSRFWGSKVGAWVCATLVVASLIAFALASIAGITFRRLGIIPPPVSISFGWQLALDLAHGGIIIVGIAIIFSRATTQSALRSAIAAMMVLDVSLAVPRYFSDNETMGASQPDWPFSGQRDTLGIEFRPQGSGTIKADFALPFSGSFNPPPAVNRLRVSWGPLYNQWVLFPGNWEIGSGGDINVLRDSIMDTRSTPDCAGDGSVSSQFSSGRVTQLLATTVNISFVADCDRLLVFTDSWAPGWSATIDGIPTPVLRINNAIRGVMVPAGEHSLVWHYRPRFLAPLLALLATGLGISGILIAAPWWSRPFPIPIPQRLDRAFGFGAPPPETIRVQMIGPLAPDNPVPAVAPSLGDITISDGHRLSAIWRYGLPVAIPFTGLALLVLVSGTAYDPRIDGPTEGFHLFLFRSVLAGIWAWIIIAGQSGFRSAIGPSVMLLVILPPLALQVARHTYPIQLGTPLATIATDFRSPSWQDTWEVTRRGNATSDTSAAGTVFRNDGPNAIAVTFATRPIPQDLWPWWRRPLGRIGPGPLDLTWTAFLGRSGPYYTVATLGRLTIQALKGGYLVTAPVPGGDVRGDFVETPATGQPGPVRWLLRINPDTGATLSIDDRQIWMGGNPGVIERITLGDASNDPEHGGSMTITDASIVQRVSLSAR